MKVECRCGKVWEYPCEDRSQAEQAEARLRDKGCPSCYNHKPYVKPVENDDAP